MDKNTLVREIIEHGVKIQNYQSKRNHVCLMEYQGSRYVVKDMQDEKLWEKEIQLLQQLSRDGSLVPDIIEAEYPYIILEYLDGKLLIDVFEEYEMKCSGEYENKKLIGMWLEWLEGFYDSSHSLYSEQYICLDINFRNYMLREMNHQLFMYGFDFEQCRQGVIETDIGRMMAFALMYHPAKTRWKQQFIDLLAKMAIEKFNLNKALVQKEYEQELLVMKTRRNVVK